MTNSPITLRKATDDARDDIIALVDMTYHIPSPRAVIETFGFYFDGDRFSDHQIKAIHRMVETHYDRPARPNR